MSNNEVVAPKFSQAFRFLQENYSLPSNLELLNDRTFSTYEEANELE